MTALYYDLEFIEDGQTIRPLSIGMVDDAGCELYRVLDDPDAIRAAVRHPWLREHVVPHLPVIVSGDGFEWDYRHADYAAVVRRRQFVDDVRSFIVAEHRPKPELWGWYVAYDHVALCQLFGSMVDLPEGVPMFTNDLKQAVQAIGNPRLPDMPGRREHHPLDDAREVKFRREWLAEHQAAVR